MKFAGQPVLALTARRALEHERQQANSKGTSMATWGQRARFERLITKHLEPANELALRLTNDAGQAEDLVQEAMLRSVKSWASFRSESTFKTWLFRILINVFRDQLKRRKHLSSEVSSCQVDIDQELATSNYSTAVSKAETKELAEIVSVKIAELPERQREVLILSTYQQLSCEEIARIVGVSVANVYSTLSAARKKLREKLEPYMD